MGSLPKNRILRKDEPILHVTPNRVQFKAGRFLGLCQAPTPRMLSTIASVAASTVAGESGT